MKSDEPSSLPNEHFQVESSPRIEEGESLAESTFKPMTRLRTGRSRSSRVFAPGIPICL